MADETHLYYESFGTVPKNQTVPRDVTPRGVKPKPSTRLRRKQF